MNVFLSVFVYAFFLQSCFFVVCSVRSQDMSKTGVCWSFASHMDLNTVSDKTYLSYPSRSLGVYCCA